MHASVSFLIAALSVGAFAVPLTYTNSTSTPVYWQSTSSSIDLYKSTSTPAYKQSTTTPYVSTTTKYAEDKTVIKTDAVTKTETKTLTEAYYTNGYTSYKTYLTSYVYTTTTKYAVPYKTYAPEPTYYQANGCPAYITTVTVKEAPSGAAYYYSPGQKCNDCQEVKYYDVSLGVEVTIYVPHVKETVYQPRPTPYEYCQYGYDNHGKCKKQTSSHYQYTTSSSSKYTSSPTSASTRSTTTSGHPSGVKTILPVAGSLTTTSPSFVRPDATILPVLSSSSTATFSIAKPDATILPVKGSSTTTTFSVVAPNITTAPLPQEDGPTPMFEVIAEATTTGA